MSQSTNDFYPTALKVAILLYNAPLLQEVDALAKAFRAKGAEFADIIKMGRTETQDAVPMTLGQEFNAFAAALEAESANLRQAEAALYVINMGATAIGTGLNAPKGYAEKCTAHLAKLTGKKIVLAPDLIAATSDLHGFVVYSAALKSLAAKLVKISTDLMFLSSGPRTGINEIKLPPMQPGSSIMPGKVNPVMPELMTQVSFTVIGNDVAVSLAQQGGLLQLNAYEPVAAGSILESQRLLIRTLPTLRTKCVEGITANRDGQPRALRAQRRHRHGAQSRARLREDHRAGCGSDAQRQEHFRSGSRAEAPDRGADQEAHGREGLDRAAVEARTLTRYRNNAR